MRQIKIILLVIICFIGFSIESLPVAQATNNEVRLNEKNNLQPKIAKVPTFDEKELAAKLILNAANQKEAVYNLGYGENLRQRQLKIALVKKETDLAKQQLTLTEYQNQAQQYKQQIGVLEEQMQAPKKNTLSIVQWLNTVHLSAIFPKANGQLKAILTTSGESITTRQGQIIKGGIQVTHINTSEVILKYEEKSYYFYND